MADTKEPPKGEEKEYWVSGILTVTFQESVRAVTPEAAEAKVREMKGVDLQWESEDIEITGSGVIGG